MDSNSDNQNSIFMGNLHHGIPISQLKQRIIDAFEYFAFYLQRKDILVKRNNKTFAFVFMKTSEDVNQALELLPNYSKLSELTNPGDNIMLERKRDKPRDLRVVLDDRRKTKQNVNIAYPNQEASSSSRSISRDHSRDSSLTTCGTSSRHSAHSSASNSSDDSSSHTSGKREPPATGQSYRSNQRFVHRELPTVSPAMPATASDSVVTHMKRVATLRNKGYYVAGETLGTETRHLEYKAAQGNFTKYQVQDAVAKYVCAFLNSDGGTLLLGVHDNCRVLGVELTHKEEDLVRQKIDGVITHMFPHIFPNMYRVQFVPVVDKLGKLIDNLKIVEISVGKGAGKRLYQTHRGEVYIRRDGSVQGPLKAAEIQTWTMNVIGTHSSHAMLHAEMKRLKSEHQQVLEKNQTMQQQLSKFHRGSSKANGSAQSLSGGSVNQPGAEVKTEAITVVRETGKSKLASRSSHELLREEVKRLKKEHEEVTQKNEEMVEELRRLQQENIKLLDQQNKAQSSKICVLM